MALQSETDSVDNPFPVFPVHFGCERTGYRLAAGGPWFLPLGDFFRLCGSNLGWRAGVIPIVTRHSFRNLFRRELAVIFRMQNIS
jgi:hypothetical protein